MQKNILRYIWTYSRPQQFVVVALTLISFPILYMTLELPKWIINDALSNTTDVKNLFGYELTAVPFLVVLCVTLLVLIVFNGLLKMRINTYKGIIGERLVRRLRFSLIERLLRFPLAHFSRVSAGETISTVTAETEPLAGYIGESIALPLFQGGTMVTILIFMFAQDWVFGLVSIALIPVQGYVIPKLQKQVNVLKKERVRHVRKLSERIGETVSGVQEIRLQGTEPYTLAEFSGRFGDLFWVRLEIFRKKFFMKFLNNTIGQITPFLFYLFGGYLVIRGDLTIGALVAAIAAYKDLTSPWKELLNHYQAHEDSKIKYEQIIELFNPDGLVDLDVSEDDAGMESRLEGDLHVNNVSWLNENGERVLSGVSLDVPAGSSIAIVGDFSVRRARLAQLLAGLDVPASGSITVGDTPLLQLPRRQLRTRVAYQGPSPYVFSGTISDNIRYSLNHRPPSWPQQADDAGKRKDREEALSSGNSVHSFTGSWVDYGIAEIDGDDAAVDWQVQVSAAIGANQIVYERSMFEIFEPESRPELVAKLMACRRLIERNILESDMDPDTVARFDPDVYNLNASVAENILFGIPVDARLDGGELAKSEHLVDVLSDLGLLERCTTVGAGLGSRLLEMMEDLPPGSLLMEEFGLADDERIAELRTIIDSYDDRRKLKPDDAALLLQLFLKIIPEKHRFIALDYRLTTQLLQARRDFSDRLPASLEGAVVTFDRDAYHPKLTVKDNLLFGRIASSDPEDLRLLDGLISDAVDETGVRPDLLLLLSESQVGISGSRLPEDARHRIPLGRVLAKRPDIIIFHDALGPFDVTHQARIRANIRELLPESSMIWLNRDIPNEAEFDRVYEFTEAGPLRLRGQTAAASPVNEVQPRAQRSSEPYALISHAKLFSPLSPSQHRFLADHSRIVQMPAGSWIYHAGDPADSAWLVMTGTVSSWRPGQQDQPIGRLTRLEVLGSLDLLAARPRMLSCQAETNVTLLRIDGDAIEDLAEGDARVSRGLLRALTEQWTSGGSVDDDEV